MLTDARTLRDGAELAADICVAGGGAAGITLARALADSRLQVLLLESGGFTADAATQALYAGTSVGQDYWALDTSRLRYFGGSTNHWTGWCRPLDPIDFEDRPGMLGGWPLSYQELLPHYHRAQRDCELASFDYRADTWADRYRARLAPVDDPHWETIAWQFSTPTRFGETYRQELVTSENVHVLLHANLSQIELCPTGGRVDRWRVRCLNGPSFSVVARGYVLALGGLENPRVLLASNSVEPRGVGNRFDTVGRYFSDHPHSKVGLFLPNTVHDFSAYTGIHRQGAGTYVRFSWALSDRARRALGLPGVSVTLDPPGTEGYPEEAPGVGSLMEQLGARPGKTASSLFLRAEQPPNPHSRVRLGRSRDALGMPRIELDWRVPGSLDYRVREAVHLLARALGQNSVGRVLSFAHTDDKPADAWPILWGGHHHLGATRMSEDPKYGVVDRNCKLHTVDNLYCAGSSTFATAGYANPTLTICALARRLGAHLAEQYA
ncbi:MAG TPA: GMC family oxidoreductase [Polyangiaceae bacterium]|nr:GMC family oxidoreductase [Polyangiaceae bacterium]